MLKHHFRDLLIRAAGASDGVLLDRLADQFAEAEKANTILRVKGYGTGYMPISAVAAQVPNAFTSEKPSCEN